MTRFEIQAIIRFMSMYNLLCIGSITLIWYKLNKLRLTKLGKCLKYTFIFSMICLLSYASNLLLNFIVNLH